MQSFRDLLVWQKGHALTLATYRATGGFPDSERFGLTSQARRAAASIGANIAEGCGLETSPDFARFLGMASGSASELEYHLLLARDLDMLSDEVYHRLVEETTQVKRMLTALIRKVRDTGKAKS